MSILLVLVYAVVAIAFIWWALQGAKKLESEHGHGSQPAHGHGAADVQPAGGAQHEDDLTKIRGIGAVITAKLRTLGFTTYEQIASLSEADIEKINESLNFKGRIEREQWIQQAQEILARRG